MLFDGIGMAYLTSLVVPRGKRAAGRGAVGVRRPDVLRGGDVVTERASQLITPFPYFGGKLPVAELVWLRLGDVPNYIEPFFGTGAVLLNRWTFLELVIILL